MVEKTHLPQSLPCLHRPSLIDPPFKEKTLGPSPDVLMSLTFWLVTVSPIDLSHFPFPHPKHQLLHDKLINCFLPFLSILATDWGPQKVFCPEEACISQCISYTLLAVGRVFDLTKSSMVIQSTDIASGCRFEYAWLTSLPSVSASPLSWSALSPLVGTSPGLSLCS